jgi:prepilin-type N-terminal cleavage/methylation domain-containing protein
MFQLKPRGFTLIELLVTITVFGIMLAIGIPTPATGC